MYRCLKCGAPLNTAGLCPNWQCSEEVKLAASSMREAAERMNQAAAYMDDVMNRQRSFMDEWLARFEQIVSSERTGDA